MSLDYELMPVEISLKQRLHGVHNRILTSSDSYSIKKYIEYLFKKRDQHIS